MKYLLCCVNVECRLFLDIDFSIPTALNELSLVCDIEEVEVEPKNLTLTIIARIEPRKIKSASLYSGMSGAISIHSGRMWKQISNGTDRLFVLDEMLQVLYEKAGDVIELTYASSSLETELDVLKILRTAIENSCGKAGLVKIHSAGMVMREEVGLSIVGPKYAGKTTLLLLMLRWLGGSYVCGDKAYLNVNHRRIVGAPSLISIREFTYRMTPQLHDREIMAIGAKRYFDHKSVCKELKVSSTSSTEVGLILIPRSDWNSDTLALRKIESIDDKRQILERHVYNFTDNITASWLLTDNSSYDLEALDSLLDLPWVSLVGNPWRLDSSLESELMAHAR